jgi:hydrogenase maturation factor HypF (carbamoyltransferase family)
MQDGFNCIETSSAGRILDAVSVLLGFSENERKEKHGATYLLEKNSTKPYRDLRPKLQISSHKSPSNSKIQNSKYILDTTHLFKYLLKYIPMNVHRNVHRDPRRLAATAQLYIAEGMHEIIKKHLRANEANKLKAKSYLSGGLSENTIIKKYFISQGLITSKEKSLIARGDKGISVGQIIYYLQNKK